MTQKKISLSNYHSSFHTKAIEIIIIALAVLVPIAIHLRCDNPFTPAKEFTLEALVIIGLMFWAFKIISREEIRFTSTPLNLPILSFIAICTLSLIWSDTFFTSLKELPLFLAGPLLYFVIVNNVRGEKQINRIISTVIIVGAVLGLYGIFQYNDIEFSFWVHAPGRNKMFGLSGNVGYFAGYLILPLSLAIPLFLISKNKIRKILLLIGIVTMGTTLIVTLSRSPYAAFGFSLLFMFLLFLLARGKNLIKENKKIFIFLLIVIILAVFLFVIPTPLNKQDTVISQIKRRISITQLTTEFISGGRTAIWKFTGMMIKDHPFLGSGIGTFKYNTLRYQAKFFEKGDNRSIYPHDFSDKVHNEYLQLWAELGIIGLAIFLWLIVTYFIYGIKSLKREKDKQKQGLMIGLMGAVFAFLVDSFFWFPLHLPTNLSLFWLFIGLSAVIGVRSPEEKKEKLEAEKINNRQEERSKDKKEKSDNDAYINKNKRTNIYRFKPVLYMIIALLAVFLCVTVFRPFMARIIWYSRLKEVEKENWEKVTDIYERALKWDPHEGYFHFELGEVFLARGLGNTALKSFKEAEKYRDFPGLPGRIAIIYLAKGNLDEAIDLLKKAISYRSTERKMAPLYFELGNAYLKLKKYELAETAFKDTVAKLMKAISYQPTEEIMATLYFELGNAYLKLEKYELAETAFKNAIRINSNLLAEAELEQNRTDEELVEFKSKINSNLVGAHYGLSEAYLKLNKTEEGVAELKKVIELAPDSEAAKYAQETIQKIEQAKPESQPTNQ